MSFHPPRGGGAVGIVSLNGDTTAIQTLSVGTTNTNLAIVDNGSGGHVFNLTINSLNFFSKSYTIGGFAQDLQIYTSTPAEWTIVKVAWNVVTPVAVTAELRTATGGGGSAISAAISQGTAGYFPDYTITSDSPYTLASGSAIWIRLSGPGLGVAGVLEIYYTT